MLVSSFWAFDDNDSIADETLLSNSGIFEGAQWALTCLLNLAILSILLYTSRLLVYDRQ